MTESKFHLFRCLFVFYLFVSKMVIMLLMCLSFMQLAANLFVFLLLSLDDDLFVFVSCETFRLLVSYFTIHQGHLYLIKSMRQCQ